LTVPVIVAVVCVTPLASVVRAVGARPVVVKI